MTKLNDIQLILLANAATREAGGLLPVPASIADAGERVSKAIAALVKRGFVEERLATDAASTYRTDGEDRFGMYITDTGHAAINVETTDAPGTPAPAKSAKASATKPERQTKSAVVIALLQRDEGATLAEMVEATGWLPHTTRAALTGLKKKGHVIDKGKRGDVTCYRIVAKA